MATLSNRDLLRMGRYGQPGDAWAGRLQKNAKGEVLALVVDALLHAIDEAPEFTILAAGSVVSCRAPRTKRPSSPVP